MSIALDFSEFVLRVLDSSSKPDATIGLCDYKGFFRFVKDVLPFVRHTYGDFVQMLANLSSSILRNHSNAFCAFDDLCEELKVFLSTGLYVSFVDFLLCLLRVSPSSASAKLQEAQNPNAALTLFSLLLQQVEMSGTSIFSSLRLGLKSTMTPQVYMKFFDVLRAFPIGVAHSTLRLLAWWRFLCILPEKMLSDGFRRFVSPFLANLLGRYISITACLGDPNFHRYQLSSTSVYNGDVTAQDLAAYVFSCIFEYPELEPEVFLKKEKLPKLVLSSSFLSEHNYQLLVAVFHWLRYLSGSGRCVGDQKVADIWVKCLKCIRHAISVCKPNDEAFKKVFMQQILDLSLRLVSSQTPCDDPSSSGSLIEPSDIDISQNPTPGDCITILHEIADSLDFEKLPLELKSALNYDICASCLNLISAWHRDCCSSDLIADSAQDDIMKAVSLLAVESVEKDARLAVKDNIAATAGGNLKLLRALLVRLVPECVDFVDRHLKLLDTLYCIPSSSVSLTLNTARANGAGLQVWVSLTDRLTQLTVAHRVTDPPKSGTKEVENLVSDFPTMFAFCLAPTFLAGSSTAPPSPELEQKVLSALFGLFRVLHTEACLLTSIPVNSWIDKISDLIIALIQNDTSEFGKKINMRIVSNFVSFMVKSAEGIEENFKDPFSPSKWRVQKDRPLGQMTGPVNAISCCLGVMPLEHFEMSVCNSVFLPPTRRHSSRTRNLLGSHVPTDGPQSPTKLYEMVFWEGEEQDQDSHTVQSVTCNLLHSLFLILQRHIRSVETLLTLIELSSTGLLTLAKRLNSTCTLFRDDEVPAIIVTAFEAFVTLAWNRLQKCFCKPGVVESLQQQKEQELKPLELPQHAVRQLLVFFEAAVYLASSPFSALEYRLAAAAKSPSSPISPERGRYKRCCYFSSCLEAIISRRRKVFIMCIVSLWDTLVVSAPADAADLRDRIRSLTGQFSKCLVVVSPQISLYRRVTFPDWISPTILLGREVEQSEAGNDPPYSSAKKTLIQKTRKASGKLPTANEKEPEEGCKQENHLERAQETTPNHDGVTETSQISSSQTTPKQSMCDSFLASRRLCTATDPRESLPPRRAFILARRRPSLAASQTAPQPSAANTSHIVTNLCCVASVPQQVQRRLFSDEDDDIIGVVASATSAMSKVLPSPRSRKRLNPGKSDYRLPPNLADFEDSAQFVFIPPSNCASKRMRLTDHQKERRREQRQAYLPAMYNNLDISKVSASSSVYSPISSSSSQSLRAPARPKAQAQSVGALASLTIADSQPPALSPKAANAIAGTSSGDTAVSFEPTQGLQKDASMMSANISNVSPQSAKTAVDGSLLGPAFEEEAPMCLELGEPKSVPEDDVAGAKEEVAIVVGTNPSQFNVTSTGHASAASPRQNSHSSSPPSSMLSASPVVSCSGLAVLRSPLLGRPAGLRAQRILEMGLAKAAERNRQRVLFPGMRINSQFTSPVTSPSVKQSDSPGLRSVSLIMVNICLGILRDITTPRPKTRVSFVEQPTVFILDSSESSPSTLWLKGIDSSTSKTYSVAPPPSTPGEIAVSDPQYLQRTEVAYPSVDTALLHDQPDGYLDLRMISLSRLNGNRWVLYMVIGYILPEKLATYFRICDFYEITFLIFSNKDIETRHMESYSPPSLSSPMVNRRRKSTPPRRRAPINRASRGTLRSPLGGSGNASPLLHPPLGSGDCASSRVPSASTRVRGTEVDLDALTSPLQIVDSKLSQDSSPVAKMPTASQREDPSIAEVDRDVLADVTTSVVQAVPLGQVTEKDNEKDMNNEDVVGGGQGPGDVEVIIVSDTEAEQNSEQVRQFLDNPAPERHKRATEVYNKQMDTALVDAGVETTVENVAQDDAIGQVRGMLGALQDRLLLIPCEQQKELLLEVLALFKNIIP
ncbi:unnamed protein product [Hydatigera taeniaeformis]|uniref:DUF2428 domain-containing protein n=1 Tax=Hydatigena taeniaeformis TaxID=6205 RepID=A0A0R3X566_HYDTA|nr:unnamed protein product [Hydatigera taeniaeformis]